MESQPTTEFPVRARMVDGYAALMRGDLDLARVTFSEVTPMLPNSPLPAIMAATVALVARDLSNAIRHLRQAARQFPENALVRAHLAEAYLTVGNRVEAQRQLARIDQLDAPDEVREFATLLGQWLRSSTDE